MEERSGSERDYVSKEVKKGKDARENEKSVGRGNNGDVKERGGNK